MDVMLLFLQVVFYINLIIDIKSGFEVLCRFDSLAKVIERKKKKFKQAI